jgi:PAS domain S-box-containing protein
MKPNAEDQVADQPSPFGSLHASENHLKVLENAVQSARNGIVITDPMLPDNPIIFSNIAFSEMTGYQMSEIIGQNCRFLQGMDGDQPELNVLREAIKARKPCIVTLRNYKKDGTLFWNELSVAPVMDESGECVNFIGVQNDITARKEAERQVSEFHSMVSHELRTPLTSIKASLGLIEDGDAGRIPQPAMRLIHIAAQNAQRLLKLVDDILDLKRMESGKLQLNFTIVNPDELVDDAVTSLNELGKANGVFFEKEITTSRAFCADPERVTQVLFNLIGNAIKFSPSNGKITIRVEDEGKSIYFSIRDEGPGIALDQQSKLFHKFSQVDSSDTRPQPGSGLGLSISKKIVDLHGGEIGVKSKQGEGALFWFALPVVPKGNG